MNGLKRGLWALVAFATLGIGSNALAIDTQEPVDKGAVQIDPVFALSNLHKDWKPMVGAGLDVAYGVLDGFTIDGGLAVKSLYGIHGAAFGINIGAMYTPLDTDHVDLDLRADFGYNTLMGFTLTPSIEFNIDVKPDLETAGFYFRLGLPLYGRPFFEAPSWEDLDEMADDDDWEQGTDLGLAFAFGFYFTIAERHQILLEGGFEYNHLIEQNDDDEDDPFIENGYIAIGYNVKVNDSFELITELNFNLPIKEEEDMGDYKESIEREPFRAMVQIGAVFTIGGNNVDVVAYDAGDVALDSAAGNNANAQAGNVASANANAANANQNANVNFVPRDEVAQDSAE